MKYHIIYTVDGQVLEAEISAVTFADAEQWAEQQGATYWEIGIGDDEETEAG